MKALAARPRDAQDIRQLTEMLNLHTVADVSALVRDIFLVSVQIGEVSFDDHMPSVVLTGKGDLEAVALEVQIAVSGAGPGIASTRSEHLGQRIRGNYQPRVLACGSDQIPDSPLASQSVRLGQELAIRGQGRPWPGRSVVVIEKH